MWTYSSQFLKPSTVIIIMEFVVPFSPNIKSETTIGIEVVLDKFILIKQCSQTFNSILSSISKKFEILLVFLWIIGRLLCNSFGLQLFQHSV